MNTPKPVATVVHKITTPSNKDGAVAYYKTTDYGKFKFDNSNRKIDGNHVNELVEAISAKNLLREYPIVVDRNWVVYDGQHRLLAAEKLGVEIYYIFSTSDLKPSDIAKCNEVQNPWNNKNYLETFVAAGLPEYIELNNFYEMAKHPLGLSIRICSILLADRSSLDVFKKGEFKVTRKAVAIDAYRQLLEMKLLLEIYQKELTKDKTQVRKLSLYRSEVFVEGFVQMITTPGYSKQQMMRKLSQQTATLRSNSKKLDVLDMLERIYNYKVPGRLYVRFVPGR